MVSADMCEHRWPGSSCPECREEREERKTNGATDPNALWQLGDQFQREERYIVIKRKHLNKSQEAAIRGTLDRLNIGTVECVVVESDWPEYETVWTMIEDRVTGRASPPTYNNTR